MIYTLFRIGIDSLFLVGTLTYSGVCYMLYGKQETMDEKMNKEIRMLEQKFNGESLELREIKCLVRELAKKNDIDIYKEKENDDTIIIL